MKIPFVKKEKAEDLGGYRPGREMDEGSYIAQRQIQKGPHRCGPYRRRR